MAYFAFNAGGFFPVAPAYVAILLAVVLAIRVVASSDPFEGVRWEVTAAAAAMGLYTLETLLSEVWSHSPALAIVDFDRALLYLLTLVLFGCVAHSRPRLIWILRFLAIAIVVVCACGLITRVLPHVWPITPNIANYRLSYPVTYWNVLGLLAVFGILLCLHFTSDEREPLVARVAGAAALPVLATTLYFTFSRGSIATCLIAAVIYALVARPWGLVSAALSAVPATVIALVIAYDANLLATLNPTTPAAVRQGHGVALALLGCIIGAAVLRGVLALWLDDRLGRVTLDLKRRRRIAQIGWGTTAAVAVLAVIVFSGKISHEYHRFLNPNPPGNTADLRSRLTDPGNDDRLPMWQIAWHEFEAKPILGQGAGTYVNSYAQYRPNDGFVVNAHSLYVETLDELGIVGLVLLLIVILTILVRTASLARGPNRPLYASVFAVLLAWALESGIDWDWQMPVVTIVAFALGGFMLARPHRTAAQEDATPAAPAHGIAPHIRTALGIGCLLLAVAPAYVWLSERKLNQASAAFAAGNYRAATDDALSSISILGIQSAAYEVVAYSDIHRDMPGLAIQAIDKAVSLDPNNWNYAYDKALMLGAAGLNPLAAARRALTLDPREQLVQVEWETFKTDTPSEWPSDARTIADAFTSL